MLFNHADNANWRFICYVCLLLEFSSSDGGLLRFLDHNSWLWSDGSLHSLVTVISNILFSHLFTFNLLEDGIPQRSHISHGNWTKLWFFLIGITLLSCPPTLSYRVCVVFDSDLVCCCLALCSWRCETWVVYEFATIVDIFFIVTEGQAKLFMVTARIFKMVMKKLRVRPYLRCLSLLSKFTFIRAL